MLGAVPEVRMLRIMARWSLLGTLLLSLIACVHVPFPPESELGFVDQKQVSCAVGRGGLVRVSSRGGLFGRGGWVGYRFDEDREERWVRLVATEDGVWQAEVGGVAGNSLRVVDLFTSPRQPTSPPPEFEVMCR